MSNDALAQRKPYISFVIPNHQLPEMLRASMFMRVLTDQDSCPLTPASCGTSPLEDEAGWLSGEIFP